MLTITAKRSQGNTPIERQEIADGVTNSHRLERGGPLLCDEGWLYNFVRNLDMQRVGMEDGMSGLREGR